MARPLVRISVLCALAVLLAAPWSAAAPRQDLVPAAAPQLLAQLWHHLAALWSDIGCIMDPGGCESPTPSGESPTPSGESSTPDGDIGCGMDPHGGCSH